MRSIELFILLWWGGGLHDILCMMPKSSLILGDDVPVLRQGVDADTDVTHVASTYTPRHADGFVGPHTDPTVRLRPTHPASPKTDSSVRSTHAAPSMMAPGIHATQIASPAPEHQRADFIRPLQRRGAHAPRLGEATHALAASAQAQGLRGQAASRSGNRRNGFAKLMGHMSFLAEKDASSDSESEPPLTTSPSQGMPRQRQNSASSSASSNSPLPRLRPQSLGSTASVSDAIRPDLSASWSTHASLWDLEKGVFSARSPSQTSSGPALGSPLATPWGLRQRSASFDSITSLHRPSAGSRLLPSRGASMARAAECEQPWAEYLPLVSSPLATPNLSRAASPAPSDDESAFALYMPASEDALDSSADNISAHLASQFLREEISSHQGSSERSASHASMGLPPLFPDAPDLSIADSIMSVPTGPGPYFHQEIKARVAAAVAIHRDLLAPAPITHFAHCLAPSGDFAAVLAPLAVSRPTLQLPAQGTETAPALQVATMALCTPESELPPCTANQALPPYTLWFGLHREPPMGRRAAVPAPLEPVMGIPTLAPGTSLLACAFDFRADRQRPDSARRRNVVGVVVACPPDPQGKRLVRWLSGPVTDFKWQQDLLRLRNPSAMFSPKAKNIVLQSLDPQVGHYGERRTMDGVFVLTTERDAGQLFWRVPLVQDAPRSAVAPGEYVPTIAFNGDDTAYVIVDGDQAAVHRLPQSPGAPAVLALPDELNGCTARWATQASWDASGRWVTVNYAGRHPSHGFVRWGDVWDLMPDPSLTETAMGPLRLRHMPSRHSLGLFRMALFDGVGDQVILAYASSLFRCPMDRIEGKSLIAHSHSGHLFMRTAAENKELITFANSPYFAMLWAHGLRLIYPTGTRHFGMSQTRYALREWRPAYLEALQEIGEEPSANHVTVRPWLSADGRYMFAGFDDQTIHRWDFAPGNGYVRPHLFEPGSRDHPAMRNVAITRWSEGPDPQEVLAQREVAHARWVTAQAERKAASTRQSLPNII
jgi:hypothetical protein